MGLLGKKKEIGPDTIIQRRNDLLFNEIDGEVVMLSIENGEYYGMNIVGSRIWALIERPSTFKDLLVKITQEFNIDAEQAKTDSIHFLEKLLDKKLLSLK
ncbi:MAG: PqqD family protein [Bacteroidales bacterium]|nr:PqqD family protein [Bacteroidales bacterium]